LSRLTTASLTVVFAPSVLAALLSRPPRVRKSENHSKVLLALMAYP
jgi:hypothetical protein